MSEKTFELFQFIDLETKSLACAKKNGTYKKLRNLIE